MQWHVVEGCEGENYSRVTCYCVSDWLPQIRVEERYIPIRFGMNRKIFSSSSSSSTLLAGLTTLPLPFGSGDDSGNGELSAALLEFRVVRPDGVPTSDIFSGKNCSLRMLCLFLL